MLHRSPRIPQSRTAAAAVTLGQGGRRESCNAPIDDRSVHAIPGAGDSTIAKYDPFSCGGSLASLAHYWEPHASLDPYVAGGICRMMLPECAGKCILQAAAVGYHHQPL